MNRQGAIYTPRVRTDALPTIRQATAHLRRRNKTLKRIIDEAGPCALAPKRRYFSALCEAIVSQQLAVKAAATIFARFCDLFPRRVPTPARLLQISDGDLRSVGLSAQKAGYLRDLGKSFASNTIRHRRLRHMADEDVVETLTQVRGVGVWTAEMFLIFVLNRQDVWPVDDLGIRRAVQTQFGFKAEPTKVELTELAEPWRPFRSIAAWYLWRSLDNKPMDA